MKFLQELVQFKRLDDPEDQDELDVDPEGEDSVESEFPDEEAQSDEFGDSEEFDDQEGDVEPEEPEDPNRQGMIRTVKGAHLVYKREVEDGTFEELWMYNATNLRDEIVIRKAIIAGTDIPVNRSESPDGSQTTELWTAGNAEMLLIKGLTQ